MNTHICVLFVFEIDCVFIICCFQTFELIYIAIKLYFIIYILLMSFLSSVHCMCVCVCVCVCLSVNMNIQIDTDRK